MPRPLWRRAVRWLLWGLLVLGGVLASAGLILQTDWAAETARVAIERKAAAALDRQVSIGRLDIDPMSLGVEVESLVVGGPEGLGRPLLSVGQLSVRVGAGLLGSLVVGTPIRLREILIVDPVLDLRFDEQGRSNLPDLGGDGDAAGEAAVRIEALYVENGVVRIDERSTPIEFSAADVGAVLREVEGGAYLAEAESTRVELRIVEAPPVAAALRLEARIGDGVVRLERSRLEAPHAVVDAVGLLGPDGVDLQISAATDGELMSDLGWLEGLTGRLVADLELSQNDRDWSLTGSLRSVEMGFWGQQLQDLRAELMVGPERVELHQVEARLADARIVGEAAMELGDADKPLDIRLQATGSDRLAGAAPSHGVVEAVGSLGLDGVDLEISATVDGELVSDFGWVEGVTGHLVGDLDLRQREDDWGLTGNVQSAELGYGGQHLQDLQTELTMGPDRLALRQIRARFAGGAIGGEVTVGFDRAERPVDIHLEASGFDLATALATMEPQSIVGLEGMVSADVDYRFELEAPGRGSGSGSLRIVPVSAGDPLGRALQLTGEARVEIDAGRLSTKDASISAPGHRLSLSAAVDLGERSGEADLVLATEDLAALLDVVPALRGEDGSAPWEPLLGRGKIAGRIGFDSTGFSSDLELTLEDLLVAGAMIGRGEGHIVTDSGGVQRLDLQSSHDGGRLEARGSIPFGEPAKGFSAPALALELEAENLRVGDAAPLLPFELPFDARLTGDLVIGGTLDAPSGRGEIRLEEIATLAGDLVPGVLSGGFEFNAERIDVGPLHLVSRAGQLEVSGSLDPTTGRLDARIASSPLDLAAPALDQWITGDLDGWAEISGTLSGTLDRPTIDLQVTGTDLSLAGRPLGVDGASQLRLSAAEGSVSVEGSLLGLAALSGGGRWDEGGVDLSIAVQSSMLAELAAMAMETPPEDLVGSLDGVLEIVAADGAIAAELRLDRFEMENAGKRLRNLEPVRVTWNSNGLMLESLYLGEVGSDSELFLRGSFGSDSSDMDLVVQSSIDVSWLQPFMPEPDVSGRIELLAAIGGTPDEPALNGQARVLDGRLLIEGFPHALERIEGLIFLYPQQVVIDSGKASFARGQITADGNIVLFGDEAGSYELRLRGADLDIRYPEDWRINAGGQLTLSSDGQGRLLSGVVNVERATYVRDFQLGVANLLRVMFQRQPDLVEETEAYLRETRLNISVEGDDALHVESNLASLSGDLDFTLKGSLAQPVILGDVRIDRGGRLEFGGSEYTVERGSLTFSNPFRNDPSVDLVAATTVREYDVRLNVFGPLDALETTFSSTPPLPSLDVVSLLTTRSTDSLSSFGSGASDDEETRAGTAETFLASQAASLVGQRVGTLFGLDQVSVTPLTSGSSELSTARITVGKRLSRDLYVTYSYDPSESDDEIVEFAWQLSGNVVVLLRATDQDSYTVDVRWAKSF